MAMDRKINPKERWLMTIRGEETDRLIFWPKIFNSSYMKNQCTRFQNMTIRQIHDYVGSDIQLYLPDYITFLRTGCTFEEQIRDGMYIKRYGTPHGRLEEIQKYDETTQSYHPIKTAVHTREDILLLTEYISSLSPEIDFDRLDEAKIIYKEFGDRGLVADNIGESPFMDFVEWYAGIENAQYLVMDYPDEVEELLREMQRVNLRLTELKTEYSPADVLYFTENTSTTIISPTQFSEYCKPFLTDYANLCRQGERTLFYHMCGHLKFILDEIDEIPFDGIEAVTSPPVGNTTFADVRKIIKNKCLIGGTNCVTWVHTPEQIISEINDSLNQLEHYRGIVLGTGGIIPPSCSPDTLRQVMEYIKRVPLKY